jgi:N-acetylmuramoyl-L-alanine amidase
MTSTFKQSNTKNFRAGRTSAIKYLVLHYTAGVKDTAKGNATYFANNVVKASAHYFVDENYAYQSVREGDTAYHVGASKYKHPTCRNANAIGIEMCSDKDSAGSYIITAATVTNAVTLTKELMAKYGIPSENVLRHYDVTGKVCPAPWAKDSAQWAAFKARL